MKKKYCFNDAKPVSIGKLDYLMRIKKTTPQRNDMAAKRNSRKKKEELIARAKVSLRKMNELAAKDGYKFYVRYYNEHESFIVKA